MITPCHPCLHKVQSLLIKWTIKFCSIILYMAPCLTESHAPVQGKWCSLHWMDRYLRDIWELAWVLYYSNVMNYDGFNRPTFEIVRVWRNPWKCMIQPNISMTIISYTLLNDDVPAIMKTSILCRLCLSTSQRRIENYIADFLMMELRRMYLWYISLL